jgi:type I restriction enzyme S subunit
MRTEYELGELLEYEQPTKYAVESTKYDDKYSTPVLTAGKSFILGYTNETDGIYDNLPVIIFDDFTTATQYVNFKFKVKSSAMKILKANEQLALTKYLYYLMQNIHCDHDTHKRYWIQTYSKIKVSIPSLTEQQLIVSKIEELFSKLDKGVEELNKIKEQLKIYRQAVLKEAYNLYDDKIKLEDLCFFITKGTTPPKNLTENNNGAKEIPFLKVYNLTFDGQLDFSIDPTFVTKETHTGFLNRSICLPGDVLMNIVGPPIGKVSIVPNTYSEWNINQAIVRYRCLEKLNNKFLTYFLLFSNTVEQLKSKGKTTAGQFNLTLEICRELQIPLPTIEKQVEIVDCIEQKLSVCYKIEQTVDESLQKAESLRQSILKQAFEGKLV